MATGQRLPPRTALPKCSLFSLLAFSLCHYHLSFPPEPDPKGEDVVKPGAQCGCQCLAEGRGLGFGRQSSQSLQHRFQHRVDHHPSVLTRVTGMFWTQSKSPVPTRWHVVLEALCGLFMTFLEKETQQLFG